MADGKLRVLHPALIRSGVGVPQGLWLLVLTLGYDERIGRSRLLGALIVDVSLPAHYLDGREHQRVVAVVDDGRVDETLVARQFYLVQVQVHIDVHLVTFLLDFLVDDLLLCHGSGAKQEAEADGSKCAA